MCFVDIVDSTKNTHDLISPDKIQVFYSVFLNTMSNIIRLHRGRVIKNSGDGLLYYFPRTIDQDNYDAFVDVLECGLSMIESQDLLNKDFSTKGLPPVSYRISANYGKVELAISVNSQSIDLFGPTVNVCSKINHLALSNQMIIYDDLFLHIKNKQNCRDYIFSVTPESWGNAKDAHKQSEFKTYIVRRSNDIANRIKSNDSKQDVYNLNYEQNVDNSNSSYNILLIDDDEDILFAFKSIISGEGYNVTTFSNPKYALAHFLDQNPYFYDLVIMDIRMPEINGIKLYSHLRALNPDAKVIFLSALNALEEVLSIFPEINPEDIMRKPIEPEYLLSNIDLVLRCTKG